MKKSYYFFALIALTLVIATSSTAQISTNYDCHTKIQSFTPISLGTTIDATSFVDFAGNTDFDDGVVSDIPVGFKFEFNGNAYSSVNACVNGWISVGHQAPISTITSNNHSLYSPSNPNNAMAPLWGDHVYRTLLDAPQGFKASSIKYITDAAADPNANAIPGSFLHIWTIEWKDLNITDKTDNTATATFQVKIIENPLANDMMKPDHRATIEFHYGSLGNSARASGCSVGISDSLGLSFMNGLFKSSFANGDSTRSSTTASSCWPPADCIENTVIVFSPKGSVAAVPTESNTKLSCQNFPNPFTHTTKIQFTLEEEAFVKLTVYDICGREIATLLDGRKPAGNCEAFFNPSELPSGVYEYRLQIGSVAEHYSMTFIK